MNHFTFIIDMYRKNFGKSERGRVKAFSLLLFILFLFSSPLVWAKSSRRELSRLPKDYAQILPKEDQVPQPPIDEHLLPDEFLEKPQPDPYQANTLFTHLLKAGLSLLMVLTVILAISYLLKKYCLKGNLFGGKLIHIIDTCHLGAKKSLVLVRVENQAILLGLTNQQIALLGQMCLSEKDPSEREKSIPLNSENFASQLSENSLKLKENNLKNNMNAMASKLEDRLKGLKKI
ncbi:MAG: flagellar biosynthetic protein FliO [bacterium]